MSNDKKEIFKKVEGRLHNYKYLDAKINALALKIDEEQNNYVGCQAIGYSEKTGVTYNISRSVENEIIAKEKKILELKREMNQKEIEKKQIENALTALDSDETNFFKYFYNSRNKNKMTYIAIKLHRDRSYCYTIRENLVYKVMGMLYPDYEELPLLREKTTL